MGSEKYIVQENSSLCKNSCPKCFETTNVNKQRSELFNKVLLVLFHLLT